MYFADRFRQLTGIFPGHYGQTLTLWTDSNYAPVIGQENPMPGCVINSITIVNTGTGRVRHLKL